MGDVTKIQWTDHTFNPWIGCTKVSEGCRNCYAEARDRRFGQGRWGPGAPRVLTSDANWREPLRWNRIAGEQGIAHRVFCASLADVFDVEAPAGGRERLWELIAATPWLNWQLLTKRPERIIDCIPPAWREQPRPNVWFGTSVEDQERADERIPLLLQVPAAVRFLSCEPLLGLVDLSRIDLGDQRTQGHGLRRITAEPLTGGEHHSDPGKPLPRERHGRVWMNGNPRIDWVIVGGESGGEAREFDVAWARSLVEQCRAAGVAVFVKQLGENPVERRHEHADSAITAGAAPLRRLHVTGKGGELEDMPVDLRVRQFPEVRP